MRDWLLHVLYELLFWFFLILTAPYFLFRAARDARIRSSLAARFGAGPAREGASAIWVHGVSVGEVKTARPLLEALRPRAPIAISSTTPAGLEIAHASYPDDFVFQFPLDLSFAMARVFRRIRPRVVVLMELEIWPNLLRQARRLGVPIVVVNGRISERSFRGYRRFGALMMPRFEMISLYSVQTEAYAERLRALGVPDSQVFVTGNLKYEGLRLECDEGALGRCRREIHCEPGHRILVAGSTHAGEEELLLDQFQRLRERMPELRLVLAPRHVERAAEVARLVERRGLEMVRRTRLPDGEEDAGAAAVVLVDTIGELELFYGLADVVFVGGSLVPVGGHNILEPAGLGRAVLFGPHMHNFEEEVRLLQQHQAAVQVTDAEELGRVVERLLRTEAEAAELGRRAREAVGAVRGTTKKTLDLILQCLGDGASRPEPQEVGPEGESPRG